MAKTSTFNKAAISREAYAQAEQMFRDLFNQIAPIKFDKHSFAILTQGTMESPDGKTSQPWERWVEVSFKVKSDTARHMKDGTVIPAFDPFALAEELEVEDQEKEE